MMAFAAAVICNKIHLIQVSAPNWYSLAHSRTCAVGHHLMDLDGFKGAILDHVVLTLLLKGLYHLGWRTWAVFCTL